MSYLHIAITSLVLSMLCQGALGGKFFGLCYTPFREFGICPTDEEVEHDIQTMLKHTRRIRTYSTECVNVNRILLRHATEGTLSVLLGVYIDNRPTDQQEVDYLIEALQEYPYAQIDGVVVGNEVMYRNTVPKPILIQRIHEVRNKVRGVAEITGNESYRIAPIYAVEIAPDPELAEASDCVGLNIHPFYRPDLVDVDDPNAMSDNILEAAKQQIDLYASMVPHKSIVVTEIGWPTNSDPQEMHKGDPVIGLKFLYKFTEYSEAAGIYYYWFEAFDSPWKEPMFPSYERTMSEFNFGFYKSDRLTMKEIPTIEECPGGCFHPPPAPPSPIEAIAPSTAQSDATAVARTFGEGEIAEAHSFAASSHVSESTPVLPKPDFAVSDKFEHLGGNLFSHSP